MGLLQAYMMFWEWDTHLIIVWIWRAYTLMPKDTLTLKSSSFWLLANKKSILSTFLSWIWFESSRNGAIYLHYKSEWHCTISVGAESHNISITFNPEPRSAGLFLLRSDDRERENDRVSEQAGKLLEEEYGLYSFCFCFHLDVTSPFSQLQNTMGAHSLITDLDPAHTHAPPLPPPQFQTSRSAVRPLPRAMHHRGKEGVGAY